MTAQGKTLERLAGHIEGEAIETPTKETIHLKKSTSSTPTATLTAPTPRVQAWLDAIPNVQRLPVADILRAGFSAEERNYVVEALMAAVAKANVARLTARTLIVPALSGNVMDEPEFHMVATAGAARNAFTVSPTDPERRELYAHSVTVTGHPVHTAKIGDKWSFVLDGERTPEYEYIGRFRLVGKFEDADTEWDQLVIREVVAS